MKSTELLKKQHREVMALFKKIEATDDPRKRQALMDDIAAHLTVDTALEEELFRPAVKDEVGTKKADAMILETYEEHHVVEAKMTVLKELVEHHAEEEEDEMFPMAEKRFGPERNRELAREMEAQEKASA
jgi:hypothetical protein